MVFSTLNSAAAFLFLSSTLTSLVQAGELDLPTYDMLNRARVSGQKQYKRAVSRTYGLVKGWQGQDFINSWDYFQWQDPTHGMVNYQDRDSARNKGLAYTTDSGSFVMKVDNQNWLSDGSYRDSVRITSWEKFQPGQLLVFDAAHMPYGCSTWPAFWTTGSDWPYNGEIDIVEGVNNGNKNQMTLHSYPGLSVPSPNLGAGTTLQESCDAFYNSNTGCGVSDPSTKSYGKAFNKAGGGVWATLWADDTISVYFFSRNNIPSDITSQRPNPSKWGKPRSVFSSVDGDLASYFKQQTIVINTTLCGDWAGGAYSGMGCPGTCSQRVTNPGNFDEAYWEINYVRIFSALSLSRGGDL